MHGIPTRPDVAYQALRAEIRADPCLRPEWLDSTRDDKDSVGTVLDLVIAINRLQNELEETQRKLGDVQHELGRAYDRIDALDGGDPMSRETY